VLSFCVTNQSAAGVLFANVLQLEHVAFGLPIRMILPGYLAALIHMNVIIIGSYNLGWTPTFDLDYHEPQVWRDYYKIRITVRYDGFVVNKVVVREFFQGIK